MIPNPILKVLSSIRKHRVRALLMGGQACVLYGAAEFSRDTDFAVLAETGNLARLKRALAELKAEVIAVPPFDLSHLRRGHAVHFRSHHPGAPRMRIDVMAKMRGVDSFEKLWRRRTTIKLSGGGLCDVMSLVDLVQAKKTQRDKDWPMIRRLVEGHYFEHRKHPNANQIRFWLRELRTTELLIEVAQRHSTLARQLVHGRRLLATALSRNSLRLERELKDEQAAISDADRRYWTPLRKELEKLRHARIDAKKEKQK